MDAFQPTAHDLGYCKDCVVSHSQLCSGCAWLGENSKMIRCQPQACPTFGSGAHILDSKLLIAVLFLQILFACTCGVGQTGLTLVCSSVGRGSMERPCRTKKVGARCIQPGRSSRAPEGVPTWACGATHKAGRGCAGVSNRSSCPGLCGVDGGGWPSTV